MPIDPIDSMPRAPMSPPSPPDGKLKVGGESHTIRNIGLGTLGAGSVALAAATVFAAVSLVVAAPAPIVAIALIGVAGTLLASGSLLAIAGTVTLVANRIFGHSPSKVIAKSEKTFDKSEIEKNWKDIKEKKLASDDNVRPPEVPPMYFRDYRNTSVMYVNNHAETAAEIPDSVPAQEAENTRHTFGALVNLVGGDEEAAQKLASFMHQGMLVDAYQLGVPNYIITQPMSQQGFKACVKTSGDQVEILLFSAGNKRSLTNPSIEGDKVWVATTLTFPKNAITEGNLPESVKQNNYIVSRSYDPEKETSEKNRFEAFFAEAPEFKEFDAKT
jgi:hypothetical protein